MTISIKALTVKKGKFEKVMYDGEWAVTGSANLEGRIKLELSEGIATGSGEIHVADISEKLQNKLYDLLTEIENELNNNKTETVEETNSHDSENDELEKLADILEDVTKFFSSPILVGKKEIREGLKAKGLNLL